MPKISLNLSKLCLEILWLLFSRHGVYIGVCVAARPYADYYEESPNFLVLDLVYFALYSLEQNLLDKLECSKSLGRVVLTIKE